MFKKIILILWGCSILTSCDGSKFDKKVVKDKDGNYYILKHHLGDTYFIDEVEGVSFEKEEKKDEDNKE